MSENSFLQTQNLFVGYADREPLFKDLELSLQPGKLVCFMGPNGVGKSTLIRTLAGLQTPLSGKIFGSGKEHIAVVLTDKVTASHMTVQELITFGRYPHLDWNISLTDYDTRVIQQAIDTVQVGHLLDKKLYELSDGQMQLVMIAKALTQETPVILLDEPTAHLDLNNRVGIMNLLRKLSRMERKAILVATHELDLALQTADLIWLTMADKTIKTGIPEDLVLDGSIDDVFQFKGFDLKTGRVQHEPFRKIRVDVIGDGPTYLWVRNAIEREGFEISSQAKKTVYIEGNSVSFDNRLYNKLEPLLAALLQ